jgi:hypothetical protein
MRLLIFTLLAIALSVAVQLGLDALPLFHAMHGFGTALFFLSPVAVTAGLAYAMRVDFFYALVAAFLSPFVSWILGFFIAVFVFNQQAYI